MKKKRIVRLFAMAGVMMLLAAFMAIPASAAASNVSGAIEGTWNAAKGQVQTIVNNVVFPVIDMILAVLLFVKIATAYMDSVPMVVITGQVNSDQIGRDVFQEADITGSAEPFVKHSYLLKRPVISGVSLAEKGKTVTAFV